MSKRLFLSAIATLMMVSIPSQYAMAQSPQMHHISGAITDFVPKANNSKSGSDVNGDGAVDVADISTIIDMMAGYVPSGTDPLIADVNGDGTVDVSDIAAVIDIMAGKGDTNPEENAYTSCPDGNHPHWIDLGIGTLWRCCNEGASRPEEYGGYYTFRQVASAPTQDQIKALLENCSYTWTTQNGVYGGKFTGPNGGTIFLPAAGGVWDGELDGVGSFGGYWSSTPYDESFAYGLLFNSDYASWDSNWGSGSRSQVPVRPVR